MSDNSGITANTVARRCENNKLEYALLSSADWVVLDFTDGKRSFEDMQMLIPLRREALESAFMHLARLGFIEWGRGSRPAMNAVSSERQNNVPRNDNAWGSGSRAAINAISVDRQKPVSISGRQRPLLNVSSVDCQKSVSISGSQRLVSISGNQKSVSVEPQKSISVDLLKAVSVSGSQKAVPGKSCGSVNPAQFSNEVCLQYLPPRFINDFRAFTPKLTDDSLDLPVEIQVFAEFIHENLSKFTPCDLLGLVEGQFEKPQVKQAYVLRTKQFHPDRYFRKNLGPFQPRIAAIFKAVTAAYTKLQSGR